MQVITCCFLGGFGGPDPLVEESTHQEEPKSSAAGETKKVEKDREEDLTDDELGLGDPLVEESLTEEDLEREWKEEEERKIRLKEGEREDKALNIWVRKANKKCRKSHPVIVCSFSVA